MIGYYYECHVTLLKEPMDMKQAVRIGAKERFKLSSFFDQNIGARAAPKQDFIFTARGKDKYDIRRRMDNLLVELFNNGLAVARFKIEDTLLDSKIPASVQVRW